MNITLEVEIKGKLFDLKAQPIVDAVKRSVQTLVENGEERLDLVLRPRDEGGVFLFSTPKGAIWAGPGHSRPGQGSQGHYRRNLQAKVDGLNGRIDDGKVLYGPWLEGIGSRNQTTRFKGYHSFRLTAQELQKQAPEVLTKQLDKAMRELNQ